MTQRITIDVPPEMIRLCHSHGVEPEFVLRGFVADLCRLSSFIVDPREDGYNSNGSDERELANEYYDRVGYPYWNLPPI